MGRNLITRGCYYNIEPWHNNVSKKNEVVKEAYIPSINDSGLKGGGTREVIIDYGCGSGEFTRLLLHMMPKNHIIFSIDNDFETIKFFKKNLKDYPVEQIAAEKTVVKSALETDVSEKSKVFLVYDDNKEFVDCLPDDSVESAFYMFPGPECVAAIPGMTQLGDIIVAQVITLKSNALLFCKTLRVLKPGSSVVMASTVEAQDWGEYSQALLQEWQERKVFDIPYRRFFAGLETEHIFAYTQTAVGRGGMISGKQWLYWLKFTKDDDEAKKEKNAELEKILEDEYDKIQSGITSNRIKAFPEKKTVQIGKFEFDLKPGCFVRKQTHPGLRRGFRRW